MTEEDLAITHGTTVDKGQELPKETNESHLQLDRGSINSNLLVSTHLEEIGPSELNEKIMDFCTVSHKKWNVESPSEIPKYTTRS